MTRKCFMSDISLRMQRHVWLSCMMTGNWYWMQHNRYYSDFSMTVVSILSPNTVWYPQLKWGLTFNAFTQPQSISHFSSTRPQRELLKRDSNSKSLISHRATVNPSRVTLSQWHPNAHTDADTWTLLSKSLLTNDKKKTCLGRTCRL